MEKFYINPIDERRQFLCQSTQQISKAKANVSLRSKLIKPKVEKCILLRTVENEKENKMRVF